MNKETPEGIATEQMLWWMDHFFSAREAMAALGFSGTCGTWDSVHVALVQAAYRMGGQANRSP